MLKRKNDKPPETGISESEPVELNAAKQFLVRGADRAARPVRLVMHGDGRLRILCEICMSLSVKQGRIEDPPMSVLPLPSANVIGFEDGMTYLLGPAVNCTWCLDTGKRAAARAAEEEKTRQAGPQAPINDFVEQTLRASTKPGSVK